MSYRNGTYVTFNANETTDPTASDIKYFNTLKMWDANKSIEFQFVNSHDKTSAVRDTSKKKTLEDRLKERLNCSKNMILIVTDLTKKNDDWVPFEIKYACDECCIPIICAYVGYSYILNPSLLSNHWPYELAIRIEKGFVQTIHIPFKKHIILDSIQYGINNLPPHMINYYTKEFYENKGIVVLDSLFPNY